MLNRTGSGSPRGAFEITIYTAAVAVVAQSFSEPVAIASRLLTALFFNQRTRNYAMLGSLDLFGGGGDYGRRRQ